MLDASGRLWQSPVMDADEREIYHYLSTWGSSFVNVKEICRRASSKKRFASEPDWAREPLLRMVERGVLECDSSSRFRIKPEKKDKNHKWIAPDINKILQEGGVAVEGAAHIATDEDLAQL
jgi:hypothetical protein